MNRSDEHTNLQPATTGKPSSPRWALERALRKSGLPPGARHVALVLAQETNGTLQLGRWSPTVGQIAEWTGIEYRWVRRRLKELEQAGWLVVEKEGRRNRYTLSDGKGANPTPVEQDGKESPAPSIEVENRAHTPSIEAENRAHAPSFPDQVLPDQNLPGQSERDGDESSTSTAGDSSPQPDDPFASSSPPSGKRVPILPPASKPRAAHDSPPSPPALIPAIWSPQLKRIAEMALRQFDGDPVIRPRDVILKLGTTSDADPAWERVNWDKIDNPARFIASKRFREQVLDVTRHRQGREQDERRQREARERRQAEEARVAAEAARQEARWEALAARGEAWKCGTCRDGWHRGRPGRCLRICQKCGELDVSFARRMRLTAPGGRSAEGTLCFRCQDAVRAVPGWKAEFLDVFRREPPQANAVAEEGMPFEEVRHGGTPDTASDAAAVAS